ncbi:MAG TPA: acyl-CoA dehydrogenase family protein [Acidimicrobiales bacterium]
MASTTGTTTVQSGQALDGPSILANARTIAPLLREEADACERGRRLTDRAVEALRAAGAFRMPMPRSWGGPELDMLTQIDIIEELSRADGSAGWCAMIGSDGGFFSAALDDEVGRTLYRDLDAVTAGFIQQPIGRLDTVEGGYRLSGRWPFCSGCTHADVMVAGAVVHAGGTLVTGAGGFPEHRIALLPPDRVRIADTWYTTGLAGSGSHAVECDDVFVPAEHTFLFDELAGHREGALYSWPGAFFHNIVAVPLGIALGALDAAEEMLAERILLPEQRPARDDGRVRTGLARAEAMVGSSRSYTRDVVGDLWTALEAGGMPSHRQRAALAGAVSHVCHSCHEAVQLLADTVGSSSIYTRNPLERRLRDLTTLRQHVIAQPKILEVVGGLWLDGADLHNPLLSLRII